MFPSSLSRKKRKVAERITELMIEEIGTAREAVSVAFVEVSPASYARAGVLQLDRQKT